MKKIKTRLISWLLMGLMIVTGLPVTAYAEEESETASFVLAAVTESGPVIEPEVVTCGAEETILSALQKSGHTFTGIETGYIDAIDGVEGNFVRNYDGGAYDLTASAGQSGITVILFTDNAEQGYIAEVWSLIKLMSTYRLDDSGLQSYEGAVTAYRAALDSLYSATAQSAASLENDLQIAMDKYKASQEEETVTLTLDLTQDGAAVPAAGLTMTGEYGNVVTAENVTSLEVVPGTYSFDISDGAFSHVRGSLEVTEGMTLTAELPSKSAWIAGVDLSLKSEDSDFAALPASDASPSGCTYYVPDQAGPDLYISSHPADGVDTSLVQVYVQGNNTKKAWDSYKTTLKNAVPAKSQEASATVLEARKTEDASGYVAYQTYTLSLRRSPTLSGLTLASDGAQYAIGFSSSVTDYALTASADTLSLTPTCGAEGESLTINGSPAVSGSAVSLSLADCPRENDSYTITIGLTTSDGLTNTYTLRVTYIDSVSVTVTHDSDVTTQVKNAAGSLLSPSEQSENTDTYRLTPGETYTLTGTKEEYYHTDVTLTAEEGLTVACPAPNTEDDLTAFEAGSSSAQNRVLYESTEAFTPSVHEYTNLIPVGFAAIYIKPVFSDNASFSISYPYQTQKTKSTYYGRVNTISFASSQTSFKNMPQCINVTGQSNTADITLSKTEDGVRYYQDYHLTLAKVMEISDLAIEDQQGMSCLLKDLTTGENGFLSEDLSYETAVGATSESLNLNVKLLSSVLDLDGQDDETLTINGQTYTFDSEETPAGQAYAYTIPLDPDKDEEIITLVTSHIDPNAVSVTYTILVKKLPPVETTISTDPADAVIYLQDDQSGSRVWPDEEGTYLLNSGNSYTYTATRKGYVAESRTFTAGESNSFIKVTLDKAPESDIRDISDGDDWTGFRADDNNNGIISSATPTKAEETYLVWANKIGEGYGSGATGCPILVGGYLYTYAGESLVKVDKQTGEVVASGKMAGSSSFAINSPTYAEGMIFVGLSNGRVQAFNAETLESLWLYTDPLGGQPNCPITYADGYIYTGFWNSETKPANYVCLSVTDEDPTETLEAKKASWTHTDNGFYWSGSIAVSNEEGQTAYVLVPTDDGESGYTTGYGHVLSMDALTGRVIDTIENTGTGDIRSSICYDADTDAYYYTTKGGDMYKVRLNADGTFDQSSFARLHLNNYSDDPANPPMSTCTPTIYKGRAYIGVSGTGQFTAYSGHNLTVVDLESFSIAYQVRTQGYPQTSGVLTTAYEEDTEYVYVYFFDNYTPGKLRVIRDKKGQTEVDHTYTTTETYMENGNEITVETGYVLFTPSGSQAQYAICSPIMDAEGNIYFKNDSAQLMCLSATMTSLEITEGPDKTEYHAGETFDPTGLKVTAHYANGLTRDVTDCLSYSEEPLTEEDTEILISYDPSKLLNDMTSEGYWQDYQDKDGEAGTPYILPTASVAVTVSEHIHDLTESPAQAATCAKNGNTAYWTCSLCGKYFSDANGKKEIAKDSWVISYPKTITLATASYTYTGKVITPKVTVKGADGKTIAAGNYTVTCTAKAVGTATAVIKFKGNYTGTVKKTFKILPRTTKITAVTNVAKGIKLTWNRLAEADGYLIYRGSTKIKKITKNTTVTWTDTTVANGKAYQYKIIAYKVVSGTTYKGTASALKKKVFLTRPTIKSVTNSAARTMTVKWKKNAKATGYQVKYVVGSTTKTVTVKGAASLSKVIKSLKKGKTYKVYVRTYRTVSGTNYYSAWSAVKKVKIAK